MLLSLSFGVSAISIMGASAGILHIWQTGAVTYSYPLPLGIRASGSVMMLLGALAGSKRLMPVTGITYKQPTVPHVLPVFDRSRIAVANAGHRIVLGMPVQAKSYVA